MKNVMFVLLSLLPLLTRADDIHPGPYGFLSMGQSDASINQVSVDSIISPYFDPNSYRSSINSPASTYSAGAGYQITSRFGVEAQYIKPHDLTYQATATKGGAPVSGNVTESSHIFSIDAVGNIPLPIEDGWYGELRLGLAQVKGDATAYASGLGVTAAGAFSGSRTGITGGLGIRYDFNDSAFARFDIDTYKTPDQSYVGSFNIWSLELGMKF